MKFYKFLLVLLAMGGMSSVTLRAQTPAGELPLYSMASDVLRVTPIQPSGMLGFFLDDCTEISFLARSTVQGLTASLTLPNGQTVTASNVGSYGGNHSDAFVGEGPPIPLFTTLPGHNQTFTIPSQGPGWYVVNFSVSGLSQPELVVVDAIFDSPLQSKLFVVDDDHFVGGAATLALAVFEDGAPVAGLAPAIAINHAQYPLINVNMVDNGVAPDQAAGDGIYTLEVPLPAEGDYHFLAVAFGALSSGTPYARESGLTVSVAPRIAEIRPGAYTVTAIDENQNTLFDRVEFRVPVTALVGGDYIVTVELETPSGQFLVANGLATLPPGPTFMAADLLAEDFVGANEDGPLTIRSVQLLMSGSNGVNSADWVPNVGQVTQPFQVIEFDRTLVERTLNDVDYPVDTDGNGGLDVLRVELALNVVFSGNYDYSCALFDASGSEIDRITGTQNFASNSFDVALPLEFDGRKIRAWAVDGPFFVRELSISRTGARLDTAFEYETSFYPADIFEKQNGDALAVVVFNRSGQVASDLHVTFEGSDGSLRVDINTVFAAGCGRPVSNTISPPGLQTTVDIDWLQPCVVEEGAAAFVVTSDNGPLRFSSGWWSGPGGVHIGDIGEFDIFVTRLDLSDCVGPVSIRAEVVYIPHGPIVRGTPRSVPGRPCVWRLDCYPDQSCFVRMVRCCSMSQSDRVLGRWTCKPITPWMSAGVWPAHYREVRVTNPRQQFAGTAVMPSGGFPALGELAGDVHAPWESDLDVLFSDDNGLTYREGTTLESTFRKMARQLVIQTSDPDTMPPTFPDLLKQLGERHQAAAEEIGPLVVELEIALGNEPNSSLAEVLEQVVLLESSLFGVAVELLQGEIEYPERFANLEAVLIGLSTALQSYPDPSGGLANAADDLLSMAEGVGEAHAQANTGLPTPVEQDFFLWGLQNRFDPGVQHAADAMGPHVRIEIDLGSYAWYPNTIGGVTVQHQESGGRRRGYVVEQVSDLFNVDVEATGKPSFVWIKPSTHLSRVVQMNGVSGEVVTAPKFLGGDVNGDNKINMADLTEIYQAQGEGGDFGTLTPRADVDANGVVDMLDFVLALENLGEVGEVLPAPGTPIDD